MVRIIEIVMWVMFLIILSGKAADAETRCKKNAFGNLICTHDDNNRVTTWKKNSFGNLESNEGTICKRNAFGTWVCK